MAASSTPPPGGGSPHIWRGSGPIKRSDSRVSLGSQRRLTPTSHTNLLRQAFLGVARQAVRSFNRGVSYATARLEDPSPAPSHASSSSTAAEPARYLHVAGSNAALSENLINIVQLLKTSAENDGEMSGEVAGIPYKLTVGKRRSIPYVVTIGDQTVICGNIPRENAYGVREWEFLVNGERVKVNEFASKAYNGPKTEGFIIRKNLLLEAVKDHVNSSDMSEKKAVKDALDKLDSIFMGQIMDESCAIFPEAMMDADIDAATGHYKQAHDIATKLITQFTRDLQDLLGVDMGALERIEKEYVVKRDRPTIINIYTVADTDGNEQTFLNMHVPARRTVDAAGHLTRGPTIPSTLRDRPGLVNYVRTAFGRVVKNPDSAIGEAKVEITFESTRHSSYPPIQIQDTVERQAIACQNAREMIRDLAEKEIERNPGKVWTHEKPLPISVRTMMLLTPKLGDAVRNRSPTGKWKGEGETLQLEESALALSMFRNRPVLVEIGGDKLWVKPEISFMNLGTNKAAAGVGLLGKPRSPESMKNMNARGFYEFDRESHNFFSQRFDSLFGSFMDTNSEGLRGGNPKIEQLYSRMLQIKKIRMKSSQELETNAEVQAVVRDLNNKITEEQDTLERCYRELENAQLLFLECDAETRKSVASNIEALKAVINEKESAITLLYRKAHDTKKTLYLENRDTILDRYQRMEVLMAALIEELDRVEGNEELVTQFRDGLDFLRSMHVAKDIYYTEKYKNPKSVMRFQCYYLKLQSMMGHRTEFFCKSAEDRTGRVDDILQEMEIFKSLYGHYPYTDEDFAIIDATIAKRVNMFSASQNNTEENSGARGEQIGEEVNPHVLAKAGKMHAGLAKGIFQLAKKLKPSPVAIQLKKSGT